MASVTRGRSASEPRSLGRQPVLDGMRGIAILLVMLMHAAVLGNGYIGVDVFFGLSGFLITQLLCEEWERTGGISFRDFYERRARRLLPALCLLLGAFALLYVAFHPFTGWPLLDRVLPSLLFVNNWVVGLGHQHGLGALAPTWSLAQEEQFYLVWPIVLWLLLRSRLKPSAMLAVLLVVIVVLLQAVPHVEQAVPSYSPYFSPIDRSAELLIGCAGAVAWRYRFVPRALEWRPTGWLLAAGLVLLLTNHSLPLRWIYLGAVLVAVPLMINLLGAAEGLLARAVACRPLRYVGKISYGLYLCNLLVHNLLVHYLPGHSTLFYAPIVMTISFAVSSASWYLVESRVIAAGRGRRAAAGTGRLGLAWRRLTRQQRFQPAG
jgi:peptidoglycan/LPS O-acetylase OafA/YrhL